MKFERPKLPVEPRPKQLTPAEMVSSLMENIRNQFYGDAGVKSWWRDREYVLREIVLWPASWLKSRGMTMLPAAYEATFLEKLQDIKRNCEQTEIKWLPAYIERGIKDHFQHNEERILNDCKAASAPVAAVLGKLKVGAPDLVETLTLSRDVLVVKHRSRAKVKPAKQPDLFKL